MNNIPGLNPTDNNIGSLRDILFVSTDLVTSINDPIDGVLEFDCLRSGNDPVNLNVIEFTDDTAMMKYDEKKTANGPVFNIKVTGKVPKDYSFRNPDFTEMQNHEFFVITRDHNGKSRLLGYINLDGEKYGMKFKADFETGIKRNNYNGFDFEFYMESTIRPRVMEDITEAPVNPGFPIDPGDGEIGDVDPPPANPD